MSEPSLEDDFKAGMIFVVNNYIRETKGQLENFNEALSGYEQFYTSTRAKTICAPIVKSLTKLKKANELFSKELVEIRTKLERELGYE